MTTIDLTADGQDPSGRLLWLRWSARTQSGMLVNSRSSVQTEEGLPVGDVALRLDAYLRADGFTDVTITLG